MNDTPATSKKPWLSKTLWVALLSAIAAFFPPVQTWIAENPSTFGWIVSGLFAVLRLATKNKLVIK